MPKVPKVPKVPDVPRDLADLAGLTEGVPLRDFLQDAFETIDWRELRAIVRELAAKSERVQALLRPAERIETLAPADIESLVEMIFVARRHRDAVLTANDGALKNAIAELLYNETEDIGARLDGFLAQTRPAFEPGAANLGKGIELAGELLHFTFPERYWLWSRWMYDPESHTGVLPLLLDGDRELRGDSLGATYLRVGRAIAMVTQVEDAKWMFRGGLSDSSAERPFAIDVFLAATHGAYLYGVTAWRLTREFHKVIPPLPRLVRRMLGLRPNMPN